MTEICFNAIVKNEEAVILRCLKSFAPFITTWCIVDTGSTDRTVELITNFFKEQKIEGKLYERPWVDFEHNRNEALMYAREMVGSEGYCLCADADEEMTYQPGFKLPTPMTCTMYTTDIIHGCRFARARFYQAHKYVWAYPVHETLLPEEGVVEVRGSLNQIVINSYSDGARAKEAGRWIKDAETLEEAIAIREKGELWRGRALQLSRLYFYAGNSRFHGGQYELAIPHYEKRILINEFDQEIFQGYYMMAKCHEFLGRPRQVVVGAYFEAYCQRPTRYEPIYHLIRYLMALGDYQAAKIFAERMIASVIPDDSLFVEDNCYEEGKKLARMLLNPSTSEAIGLATQQYIHKRWILVLDTLAPLKLKNMTQAEKFTYYDLQFIAHSWLIGHTEKCIEVARKIFELPLKHWKSNVQRIVGYYLSGLKQSLDSVPREVQLEYLIQEALKKKDEALLLLKEKDEALLALKESTEAVEALTLLTSQ